MLAHYPAIETEVTSELSFHSIQEYFSVHSHFCSGSAASHLRMLSTVDAESISTLKQEPVRVSRICWVSCNEKEWIRLNGLLLYPVVFEWPIHLSLRAIASVQAPSPTAGRRKAPLALGHLALGVQLDQLVSAISMADRCSNCAWTSLSHCVDAFAWNYQI